MKLKKNKKRLSIIIPACNEESTLPDVLSSCLQLRPYEIIVIANGCRDRTGDIAKQFGCKTVIEPNPLGNDVGRAIGATKATGDILLFLDADFVILPHELNCFLSPLLDDSADVVLNDFEFLFTQRKCPHSTTVWRQVFNELLGRRDLGIDSILSVPHAMTKKAVRKIGISSLVNPIMAQARMITKGLRIAHQYGIDVIKLNRFRPSEHATSPSTLSRSERRIIGDHVEALSLSHILQHPRGHFTDGGRRRDIVHDIRLGNRKLSLYRGWGIPQSALYRGQQLSVIIPVQNEEFTITEVIKQVRKIEPREIIVVVNGSTDTTEALAKEAGATTIVCKEALGNDVGRAIGAKYATGDILLFIDGDFVLEPELLFPFARAISEGIDIALNDLNHYLTLKFPLSMVTALKYAVNLAAGKKDLGVGSFVAVPHAISRKALNHIHWTSLVSPVLAQLKATLHGLKADCVFKVDVDRINRIRPEQHFSSSGYPPAVERIIGDHVEALSYLIKEKGRRGVFHERHRYFPKRFKC